MYMNDVLTYRMPQYNSTGIMTAVLIVQILCITTLNIPTKVWRSGRARASHARGRGFDPGSSLQAFVEGQSWSL